MEGHRAETHGTLTHCIRLDLIAPHLRSIGPEKDLDTRLHEDNTKAGGTPESRGEFGQSYMLLLFLWEDRHNNPELAAVSLSQDPCRCDAGEVGSY